MGAAFSAAFVDFDNDGWLDIYVTNQNEPNVLYQNNSDGTFTDITSIAGVGHSGFSFGSTFGDYDNDGDVDIYVSDNDTCNVLYRNDSGNVNRWLIIQLRGKRSNRSGIGAKVRVVSGALSQMREVSGGFGFCSQNSLPVEFGLASYSQADTIEVAWPSGITDRLYDVRADTFLTIVEGSQILFTDVAQSAGVADSGYGESAVFFDYDNDNDLDLYVANMGQYNILYENNGTGTFRDVTEKSLIKCKDNHRAAIAGDYNNDGYTDIFQVTDHTHHLFRNNGDGTFIDVTAAAGVDKDNYASRGAAFVDFNNDGFLDICVNNWGPLVLYQNNGDGSFQEVAKTVGINFSDPGSGISFCDYDNDMDQDLCFVNFAGYVKFYRNNGDGTFTDVTENSGLKDQPHLHGVTFGDYDNNGLMDLYLTVYRHPSFFYRNNGDGTFIDVTDQVGVGHPGDSFSSSFSDFDNDGWLDLYTTNAPLPNFLYHNNGDGTFSHIANQSGSAGDRQHSFGMTVGDYDGDGDLDIYVANGGQANCLFRNESGNANHWLTVKVEGTVSNRSGIGARVRAVAGNLRQTREVNGGYGFESQNSLWAHFGLGSFTQVDTVEVLWPSGIIDRLYAVRADTFLTVVEGSTVGLPPNRKSQSPQAFSLLQNYPNPFNCQTVIKYILPSSGYVRLSIFNLLGQKMRTLVSEYQKAGNHSVRWEGKDEQNQGVASGVYIYRIQVLPDLEIEDFIQSKKMVLIR